MTVQLNHTIVSVREPEVSSRFVSEILGVGSPAAYGPFLVVEVDNGVSLDFSAADGEITPQHYAFLISEPEFDEVFGRIVERELTYWADPAKSRPGEINRRDGGRGVYFEEPSGHFLEVLTRPYGSGD